MQAVCFRSVLESRWMHCQSRLSLMEECILWGKNAFSHGTKNQERIFPQDSLCNLKFLVLNSRHSLVYHPARFCHLPTWCPEAVMKFLGNLGSWS